MSNLLYNPSLYIKEEILFFKLDCSIRSPKHFLICIYFKCRMVVHISSSKLQLWKLDSDFHLKYTFKDERCLSDNRNCFRFSPLHSLFRKNIYKYEINILGRCSWFVSAICQVFTTKMFLWMDLPNAGGIQKVHWLNPVLWLDIWQESADCCWSRQMSSKNIHGNPQAQAGHWI